MAAPSGSPALRAWLALLTLSRLVGFLTFSSTGSASGFCPGAFNLLISLFLSPFALSFLLLRHLLLDLLILGFPHLGLPTLAFLLLGVSSLDLLILGFLILDLLILRFLILDLRILWLSGAKSAASSFIL